MDNKVFKIVTDRFLDLFKDGIIPWEQPWVAIHGEDRLHAWKHHNGKPYSLLNQMLLPKPGEYITFNQAVKEGGSIRKGAKPCYIFEYFVDKREAEKPKDDGEPTPTPEEEKPEKMSFRYYKVYHFDDVEGLSPRYEAKPMPAPLPMPERIVNAEKVLWDYLIASGVSIDFKEDEQPRYEPAGDVVILPKEEQFKSKEYMYATAFHELTHSTGAPNRLKRFGLEGVPERDRALEELTAEIGSAALLLLLGIENDKTKRNNQAYIQSWAEALEKDPKLIVRASGRAKKAVALILGEEA